MLELKNVSFEATGETGKKEILRNISFKTDERFVAITGPNGGGKSTLAKLIAGILTPSEGQIYLDGEDITPLLFGEEPAEGNGKTDITVDLFQIRLMKRVLTSRKPVLAICRGMQILSVACGGTIWQDMSLIPGRVLNHMQQSANRSEVSHRIRIERGSRLRQYAGTCLYVNSFHHQAVNFPGRGVSVSAHAQDGTIEAIELDSHPFAIGVQWHPECMYRTSREMRDLFHEFISHSLINSGHAGHTNS